jgi:hypothetical protein
MTKLDSASLFRGDLSGATLYKANLSGAHLSEARLYGANLIEADLDEANLRGANLYGANLRKTSLFRVNLEMVNLIYSNLSNATLTGATLYGTARDNWRIDGIKCDFVYWDSMPFFKEEEKDQKQQWLQDHRVPKDREFRPGEFEELYKSLPTFEYYFEQCFTPLDPLIMNRVVQAINEQHKEFRLELINFDKRGQPHATFTVCQMEFKEPAQEQVKARYEMRIKMLEQQKEEFRALLQRAIDRPQIVERLISVGRDYFEHIDGNTQVKTGASGNETSPAERNETP